MTREKTESKGKSLKSRWSRLDHKLFRLNLAIYQPDSGKPSAGPKAVEFHQFKKAS